jgi:cystathionine beta-lyase
MQQTAAMQKCNAKCNEERENKVEKQEFDFSKQTDRHNTDSLKWKVREGELPMWVADMDFETAPEIKESIQKRANHGIYGYTTLPSEWRRTVAEWWKRRHHFSMKERGLIFCNGVIPAIGSILRRQTKCGEQVVVQTPVYPHFFSVVEQNERVVVENPLRYANGEYTVDFEDLQKKLKEPQTTAMILCNPHNPIGKIWDRETLERIGQMCLENHVFLISDEIHCDLTDPGCEYVPFASISEEVSKISVTCAAPTKTFNIPGIQTAFVYAGDLELRKQIWHGMEVDGITEPNVFAAQAAVAAYEKGEDWLDAVRQYICANKQYVAEFLKEELPQIGLVSGHATYLLWLDCSQITDDSTRLSADIRAESGLWLSAGSDFGGNGNQFLRMNIACPRESLEDGLNRLKKGIYDILK